MKGKKISANEFIVSDWSGGKTTQIAIDPPSAVYADRDFHFRISSATVDLDASDFTALPDYHRIILPITGQLTLSFSHQEELVVLNEMESCHFDGGWNTSSKGRVIDFNLMLRKGVCTGDANGMVLGTGDAVTVSGDFPTTPGRSVLFVWCVDGTIQVTANAEASTLTTGEAIQFDMERPIETSSLLLQQTEKTPAKLVVCKVHFI